MRRLSCPLSHAHIGYFERFNFIASSPAVSNFHHYAIRWDISSAQRSTFMANYMQTTRRRWLNAPAFGVTTISFGQQRLEYQSKARHHEADHYHQLRTVNDFQFGYSNNVIDIKTSSVSDKILASRSGFTYTELFPETSGSFPALNLNDGFGMLQHTAVF